MLEPGVLYDICPAEYGQTFFSYAALEVAFLKLSSPRHDYDYEVVYTIFQAANRLLSLKSSHFDGSSSRKPMKCHFFSSKFNFSRNIAMLFAKSHKHPFHPGLPAP